MQEELISITTVLTGVGQAIQICVGRPLKPAVLPMRPHSRMSPSPSAHSLLHLHLHGCTSLALPVALLRLWGSPPHLLGLEQVLRKEEEMKASAAMSFPLICP